MKPAKKHKCRSNFTRKKQEISWGSLILLLLSFKVHGALGKFFRQPLHKIFRYQCQFIFSKYSPPTSMHFCIRENQSSKQFWKSSLVRHPIASYNASNISPSLLNWIPRSRFLTSWNRKKSQGLKFGECGGILIRFDPIFSQIFSRYPSQMGSWIVIMQNPPTDSCLLSSLCNTIKGPRQTVRALIEAPSFSAIDSIKPDFMKKIATIHFPKLLFRSNFCRMRIIFWHQSFWLLFGFRIIMMKPWLITIQDVKNTPRSSLFESFQWFAVELNWKSFLIIGERMFDPSCANPP